MADFNDTLGLDLLPRHQRRQAWLSLGCRLRDNLPPGHQGGRPVRRRHRGEVQRDVVDTVRPPEGRCHRLGGRTAIRAGTIVRLARHWSAERCRAESLASRSRRKTTSMVETRMGEGKLSAYDHRGRGGARRSHHQRRPERPTEEVWI